jgi:hypothetical protein
MAVQAQNTYAAMLLLRDVAELGSCYPIGEMKV